MTAVEQSVVVLCAVWGKSRAYIAASRRRMLSSAAAHFKCVVERR
jgi:hypothetical protein